MDGAAGGKADRGSKLSPEESTREEGLFGRW